MGVDRYPTEGGSGGNRGHSNMEHWDYTDAIKEATRNRRRSEDRTVVKDALDQEAQTGSLVEAALSAQIEERLSGWTTRNPDLQRLIDEVPLTEKLPMAKQMLRSHNQDERILAVRMIREPVGPAPEALAVILGALERESETQVVKWLVSGISFRADPTALSMAVLHSEHAAPEVRDAAASAIAACSVDSDQVPLAVDARRKLASDPDGEVRFSALFELGVLWQEGGVEDQQVKELLDTALADGDPRLRQIAEEALGKTPGN